MAITAIIAIPIPIVAGLDQSMFVKKFVGIILSLLIVKLIKPLRRVKPRPLK